MCACSCEKEFILPTVVYPAYLVCVFVHVSSLNLEKPSSSVVADEISDKKYFQNNLKAIG